VIHNTLAPSPDGRAAWTRPTRSTSQNRQSLVTTAILDIQANAAGKNIGSDTTRVNVDMIYSDDALPTTTFRSSDVSNLADAVFLGSASLFTGQLVKYTTGGTAIGGLVNGNYYVVVRSADGASIQLATRQPDGSLIVLALDPSVWFDHLAHADRGAACRGRCGRRHLPRPEGPSAAATRW
jgi:hypothetical protein